MRLLVVAVADVGRSHKQLEGVVLVDVQVSRLDFLLQLPHALLAMTAEAQVLFVAPQDAGPRADARL